MNPVTLQLVLVIVSAVGVVVTAVGFGFAVWQLRREYRWRREQYAVTMLAEWNERTATARWGIDAVFTGLLDEFGPRKDVAITPEIANRIYDADAGTSDWEVKCHLTAILNYCEYVAVCVRCNVGDHAILANSFQATLVRWHGELAAFMRVSEERRGYQPWVQFEGYIQSLGAAGSTPMPQS